MWGRRSVGKVAETPVVNTVPEETVVVTKAAAVQEVTVQETVPEVAVEAALEAEVEKRAPRVQLPALVPEVPVKDAVVAVAPQIEVEAAPEVSIVEPAPKPDVNGESAPAAEVAPEVPDDNPAPKVAVEGETAPEVPTNEGPVATPEETTAKDVTDDAAPEPAEATPVLEGGEPAPQQPAETAEEVAPKIVEETHPGLETNSKRKTDILSLGPRGIALVRDLVFSDDSFERATAKLSLSSDFMGRFCDDCGYIGAIESLEDVLCVSDLNAVEVLAVMFELGQDGCRRSPKCPCGAVLMKLEGKGKYGHEKCPVVSWFCEKYSVEYDSENGVVKYPV